MTAQIPHADDAISQVVYHSPVAASASTPSTEDAPEEVAASAPQERRYSPIISYLGGRKFVLALVGMGAILVLIGGIAWRYHPDMADEQIRLVDTGAKWIVGIVSLFVGGNTAQRFATARSERHE